MNNNTRKKPFNTDDIIKPYYIVFFKEEYGFPVLSGYSHSLSMAVSYAQQWIHLKPSIYLFHAKSIDEVVNREDYKEVSNNIFITTDHLIESLPVFESAKKSKYTTERVFKREVMVTESQLADLSDGGIDVISEVIQYYSRSLLNLLRISKYVKDPTFKQSIELIFKKYLPIIIGCDGNDLEDLNTEFLHQLDNRIPAVVGGKDWLDITEYIDLYYLDFVVIWNNNSY